MRRIRKHISRIVEELFPFVHYLVYDRRRGKEIDSPKILIDQKVENYRTLHKKQLRRRLKEEYQRALIMDEKTFKLTVLLSFEFTVLSLAIHLLSRNIVSSATIQKGLTVIVGIGFLYIFLAGLLALGARRASPSYGYGTQALLHQQQNHEQTILAEDLIRQELMNFRRYYRNETVYMALRNVLFLILFGAILFLGMLYQSFSS